MALVSLRGRWEFKRVLGGGQSRRSGVLKTLWQPNDLGSNRYGIAVTTACGKAVVRNRIRRWARELLRRWESQLDAGYDIVILVNRSDAGESFQSFAADLAGALRAARLTGEKLACS
ncbi:ribonuclease P protein component [bacterium]|nr:ribonuclease P protein component [bacterium]